MASLARVSCQAMSFLRPMKCKQSLLDCADCERHGHVCVSGPAASHVPHSRHQRGPGGGPGAAGEGQLPAAHRRPRDMAHDAGNAPAAVDPSKMASPNPSHATRAHAPWCMSLLPVRAKINKKGTIPPEATSTIPCCTAQAQSMPCQWQGEPLRFWASTAAVQCAGAGA